MGTLFLTARSRSNAVRPPDNPAPRPSIASASVQPPVDEPKATPLILAGDDEAPVWTSRTPAAFRSRIVYPDPAMLSPSPVLKIGDRLELDFFNDVHMTSVLSDVTVYPNGAVGMTAKITGDYKGTLYLSYCGNELRVHAEVLGGNDFYLRYDPKLQAHVAIEVDRKNSDYREDCKISRQEHEHVPAAAAEHDEVKAVPAGATLQADTIYPGTIGYCTVMTYDNFDNDLSNGYEYDRVPHFSNPNIDFVGLSSTNATGDVSDGDNARVIRETRSAVGNYRVSGDEGTGDPETIDVMIVYTPAALAYEGSTNGINNNIVMAMQRANAAHSNSDTKVTLNLVHSAAVNYTEAEILDPTNGVPSIDLNNLTFTDGSYAAMDEVQSWRDTYHADLVCLIEDTDLTGGLGWLLTTPTGNPDRGFCLARVKQSETGYTVVHEWGHNMGCSHSKTQLVQPWDNGDYSNYSAGWQWPDVVDPKGPGGEYPYVESFESGFGMWGYGGGDVNWTRHTGSTGSSSTGPSSAYDGSWYVYTEASGNSGKYADLTATFDLSTLTDPTISFAYHMYGEQMGSISLQASSNGGSSWGDLWLEGGNHGNTWYTSDIPLSAYAGDTNVMLRFHAYIGAGFTSDIALDKIVVQGTYVNNDIDNDGMPNVWETLYFGGPTNAIPTANPDGDRYNNLQEYIAGLNPNVSDGLALYSLSLGSNNAFQWNPAGGRIYSVYWTDNLLNGFTLLQSNLTSGSFTDTIHGAENAGYYKLKVEVAP